MKIVGYDQADLRRVEGADIGPVELGTGVRLGVGAFWIRLGPGESSLPNQHDEIEVWVVAAGSADIVVDGQHHHVDRPTVIEFEPFETHHARNAADTDLVIWSVYWRDLERAHHQAAVEKTGDATFVVSFGSRAPRAALAADIYVRHQRMRGNQVWHLSVDEAAGDAAALHRLGIGIDHHAIVDGPVHRSRLDRFVARLRASGRLARPVAGAGYALPVRELRADLTAQHRLGRVPPAIRALANASADPERASVALTTLGGNGHEATRAVQRAQAILDSVEAVGSACGEAWRGEVPADTCRLVHFLDPADAYATGVVAAILYRLAYPGWTAQLDYHLVEAGVESHDDAAAAEHRFHPADAARLRLALTPADAARTFRTTVPRWLDELDARVRRLYGGLAPDTGLWRPEHAAFLARLGHHLRAVTAALGSADFDAARAARAVVDLAEDAAAFGRSAAALVDIVEWRDETRTATALELAAVGLLATCSAPLTPAFAADLSAGVGAPTAMPWPGSVRLIMPGTPVGLRRVGRHHHQSSR